MRHYQQLTIEQRYGIYSLIKTGHSQVEIAKVIGVHKSTISRELRRNRGERSYRYQQANRKAIERRKGKIPLRIDQETWRLIELLIEEDWSPEQISGWLKLEMNISVSHEWIYHHILTDKQTGGYLYRHLRCRKKSRRRYGSPDRRGEIRNKISIEKRPAIVDTKERLGDWEIDTIIGKGHKQAIVSAAERKSRFALIYKVERKTSDLVNKAIIKLLLPLKQYVHTVTFDNGKEFAGHEMLSKELDADIYFAHPYASFERGLNENTNGLFRQYFPKDRDFTNITDEEIIQAIKKLNNRPRKCLGFKTPNMVFFKGVNCCT
jgi:IS30 family transposase